MSHQVHWLKGFIIKLCHMRGEGEGGETNINAVTFKVVCNIPLYCRYVRLSILYRLPLSLTTYSYITPTSLNKLRAAASDNMSGPNAVMITSPIDVKIEYGIKILQPCLECVVSTCGQKYMY